MERKHRPTEQDFLDINVNRGRGRLGRVDQTSDFVVVGGGPGGLSAAREAARGGLNTVVLEQNHEIGSPIRTSGGSFIEELKRLGIPEYLYHPIKRGRFLSPNNSAVFEYNKSVMCVIDVRGTFQFLAKKATEAGAEIMLGTKATEPIIQNNYVVGVKANDPRGKEFKIGSRIAIDASGYTAVLSKKILLSEGFRRFGVGAEYDMHAPYYDQDEVVLIVGSQIAPSGYAWAFPWGNNRVRVGVGIIHADARASPDDYLGKLIRQCSRFGINLNGAQRIEYHRGLIPSDGLAKELVGNGIMAVGDAAGQAPTLVGEGIRWAIEGGVMAGNAAIEAVSKGDVSEEFLSKQYKRPWEKKHGMDLRIAQIINKKIAAWSDDRWDKGVEILKQLTPDQFSQALKSNFIALWPLQVLLAHPSIVGGVVKGIIQDFTSRSKQG